MPEAIPDFRSWEWWTQSLFIGVAVLLGVIVYFAIRNREKEQDPAYDKAAKVAFILGCVAIAVSTYYFPLNALKEANSLLELLTTMIQFPTRLTTIAAIAMTLVACTAGHWMLRWKDKVAKTIFLVAVCGGCIFSPCIRLTICCRRKISR